jgi:formylglycine-generating enzyme required for sulfatase activity
LLYGGCSNGKIKGTEAAKPAAIAGEAFTNSLAMKFVLIPAGSYMMGSPASEPERDDDERRHRVSISKAFYMQTTEVTQKQWREVMGGNPSQFKNCGDDCPVEMVSWYDVQSFIRNLNEREGTDKYRLPTEAEWEYACRAGTNTPFFFGECLSTNEANYDGNYPMPGCPEGIYRKKPIPVCNFPANAWGLYDMHGNEFEWCQDWYGPYPLDGVTDPTGPSSGEKRVLRGGSWDGLVGHTRCANRHGYYPDRRNNSYGFRVAMTL